MFRNKFCKQFARAGSSKPLELVRANHSIFVRTFRTEWSQFVLIFFSKYLRKALASKFTKRIIIIKTNAVP